MIRVLFSALLLIAATAAGADKRRIHKLRRSEQFKLIQFLDGQERQRRAVEASEAGFPSSWQRPKWHILVQDAPDAGE